MTTEEYILQLETDETSNQKEQNLLGLALKFQVFAYHKDNCIIFKSSNLNSIQNLMQSI